MLSLKQLNDHSEVDERLAALINNANAIRAVASSVEGTIGPKGLDTMLVDKFGGVVITNDGVTILDLMEVNHPAAKILINVAKAQQEEIGDGTTTATLIAGSLVINGVEQVIKGVPVARVIEGLRIGVAKAGAFFQINARMIDDLSHPLLKQVALVAGRDHEDIAELVVKAAELVGKEKLLDKSFRLANTIMSTVGADNAVFLGIIINKGRVNRQMPQGIKNAAILIIDDALEPEEIEEEALSTESGFNRYLKLQQEFEENLRKIIEIGVNVILVDRGIDGLAEEILTDSGVLAVQRVSNKELRRAAEHTGARIIKRTGLKRNGEELKKYIGYAQAVYEDEKLEQVLVRQGTGRPMATVQVGAATEEVVGERQRIAKDAAASVQVAVQGGVLPGGGAIELAALRAVEEACRQVHGMSTYGVECVIEALKRPFMQIVSNAGFNPLEKIGNVLAAQEKENNFALAVDCDTGQIRDMFSQGIIDPAQVKIYALKAAGEVAEAILRINTIIKMRAEKEEKTEL